MARREYDPEVKAAVMAALLAGQGVPELAERYDIPPETIRSWKSRQANGESVATVATEKRLAIGERIVTLLEAEVKALTAQTEAISDLTWVKKQPASELAVLRGVSYDKVIRLLEALGRSDDVGHTDSTATG